MSDGSYRRIYPLKDDTHKLALLDMAVKWLLAFGTKTSKDLSRSRKKKLIAVNDDINHKKMKPSAVDNKRQATNEEPSRQPDRRQKKRRLLTPIPRLCELQKAAKQ